ncbi:hypothetical protein [Streptomyces sp. NPDC010273]|uniref:hypothetical protein n=1 Tax=Streptomyces sp. NPDC010273 TaxID=3364829 RepID=UPI0036EE5965
MGRVGVGEQVGLRKPGGTFTLRPDATHHVFVGEETAEDRLPMAHSERLDWLTRGGTSLPDAVRHLAPEPGGIA